MAVRRAWAAVSLIPGVVVIRCMLPPASDSAPPPVPFAGEDTAMAMGPHDRWTALLDILGRDGRAGCR